MIKTGGPGAGLTSIFCDHETARGECGERFNSFSVAAIVPTQAQQAKWTIVERNKRSGTPEQHFCPKHKPRSVMQQKHPEVADAWDAASARARAK